MLAVRRHVGARRPTPNLIHPQVTRTGESISIAAVRLPAGSPPDESHPAKPNDNSHAHAGGTIGHRRRVCSTWNLFGESQRPNVFSKMRDVNGCRRAARHRRKSAVARRVERRTNHRRQATFRSAFMKRRRLAPASDIFGWCKVGGVKVRQHIRPRDCTHRVTALASTSAPSRPTPPHAHARAAVPSAPAGLSSPPGTPPHHQPKFAVLEEKKPGFQRMEARLGAGADSVTGERWSATRRGSSRPNEPVRQGARPNPF